MYTVMKLRFPDVLEIFSLAERCHILKKDSVPCYK
jgi:hypothetical protein